MAITHRWDIQTICQSGTWIIHWSRMASVGKQCHYLYKVKILLGGKAIQTASRSMKDKRCGTKLFLVFRFKQRHWKLCLTLPPGRQSRKPHQLHHFICGYGQHNPGNDCMLILLGFSWVRTYLLVIDAHSK